MKKISLIVMIIGLASFATFADAAVTQNVTHDTVSVGFTAPPMSPTPPSSSGNDSGSTTPPSSSGNSTGNSTALSSSQPKPSPSSQPSKAPTPVVISVNAGTTSNNFTQIGNQVEGSTLSLPKTGSSGAADFPIGLALVTLAFSAVFLKRKYDFNEKE